MKYDYPEEIMIGGHVYKIILKDASTVDECGHNQADSCQGNLEIRVGTVMIDGTQRAISQLEQSLWHEILHQIDGTYHGKEPLGECEIERLSQGLLQVASQLGWHFVYQSD